MNLHFSAPLNDYHQQAKELLEAHRAADPTAIQLFHEKHPRFLDEKIPWLPKRIPDSETQNATLTMEDAHLAIARWYDFQDWSALAEFADAVSNSQSEIFQFETAVEAVVSGDVPTLRMLLDENTELVRSRSTRITHFDPPIHRATLLHYIAANGVEGHRQKTPKNAVAVAKCLLTGGAEVDALADMYGGRCTTMSLLVSSSHPAAAGVQSALVETLLDFGASIEPHGSGQWQSPLMTALAFGFGGVAELLASRGAQVSELAAAAGLGRLDLATQLLATADPESRHRALVLAAQQGHSEIVALLLDSGEDPNRYNPKGNHGHSTPLHQAALAGHDAVVRLLVERGARLDIEDTIYHGTPLGWAMHSGQTGVAAYLRARESNSAVPKNAL
ncbi:MAG: ankyrin repeat domain-containing protein [Bryobacteraceae bacterium]